MMAVSYLIEVRGLKQNDIHHAGAVLIVVPYRGAWIETRYIEQILSHFGSYLIEVRGLKHYCNHHHDPVLTSYLIEVRGLKLKIGNNGK